MDQQAKFTKEEVLDLSSEYYQDIDWESTSWLSSTLDSQKVKTTENHTRECHKVQNNSNNMLGVLVSAEELNIRSQLEMEIEKDLEEEIKESIYHLALRLHRIYKQRKERNNAKEASEYGNQLDKRSRALSEVNISIRMEGGTKVEIKEVNKEVAERGCGRSANRPENNVKEVMNGFGAKKKLDWVKTLREGSSPVAVNRSNGSSKHRTTEPDNVVSNCKFGCARGKSSGSPWQTKRSASVDNKLVQLLWKV